MTNYKNQEDDQKNTMDTNPNIKNTMDITDSILFSKTNSLVKEINFFYKIV